MAQAPMATPPIPPTPAGGGAAAGIMPPGPSDGAGDGSDGGDNVVVTICSDGQGGYTVYAGDEPDAGSDDSDMSEDDASAMGSSGAAPAPSGGAPSPQGQPADSIGAALKLALTILQSDASSQGAPGSADDQFASGFSASKSPTPASGPASKY